MRPLLALALALATATAVGASRGIALVDAQGKLALAKDIIASAGAGEGGEMRVLGVLNSKGASDSEGLLERALGGEAAKGLPQGCMSLSSRDGTALLECSTVSSDLEARMACLMSDVCGAIVLHTWRSDVGREVAWNSRALKAVMSQKLRSLPEEPQEEDETAAAAATATAVLVIPVHDCDAKEDRESLEAAVMADVQSAWDEVTRETATANPPSLGECFDVRIQPLAHSTYQPEEYAADAGALAALVSSLPSVGNIRGWGGRVMTAWSEIQRLPPPLPGRSEMTSAFHINKAHNAAALKAGDAIKRWWKTVGAGKTVPDFGSEADSLLSTVLADYESAARRYGTIQLYSERREQIKSMVQEGAAAIFKRQVSKLVGDAIRQYKRELLKLHKAEKLDDESEAALLRQVLFEFETEVSRLQADMPGMSFEDEYEELEADLCDFSDRFGQSPAAQLRALNKVEKRVNKAKSPGERSIQAGLNLVGFIRQPGYGNLQMFGGYRMGPHTVTVGYANDGSTPEAMQNGRAPPLLRVQPKINLDIDL
jgi:hypothetical protein